MAVVLKLKQSPPNSPENALSVRLIILLDIISKKYLAFCAYRIYSCWLMSQQHREE